MSDATILVKTRKGLEEMAHRTGTVPQKLRSVLILVDGKSRRADLLKKCTFIPQCDEHLEWLLQNGFVEAEQATVPNSAPLPDANSPRMALLKMAKELLGTHAGTVVQRFHDTEDTHEALAQTLDRCHKLIRLSIDEKKAEQFRRLGTALLSPAGPSA
ncbi:MAG: hypothetical protein IPF38_19570 [Burkholderiales bacterium]|uniref:hypothetical protein n=1 Tax=Candidatus Aalborgicola defluviihabitans TaxID=3386187 RepID=UPI001D7EBD67|nr:hypothetical protein [Burkholderiales bacterium]MBK6569159.1 hypothetical protein [Burkholderiales bacterium]MBL0243859.1 hypothetical protein [Rhodoferax sp.]